MKRLIDISAVKSLVKNADSSRNRCIVSDALLFSNYTSESIRIVIHGLEPVHVVLGTPSFKPSTINIGCDLSMIPYNLLNYPTHDRKGNSRVFHMDIGTAKIYDIWSILSKDTGKHIRDFSYNRLHEAYVLMDESSAVWFKDADYSVLMGKPDYSNKPTVLAISPFENVYDSIDNVFLNTSSIAIKKLFSRLDVAKARINSITPEATPGATYFIVNFGYRGHLLTDDTVLMEGTGWGGFHSLSSLAAHRFLKEIRATDLEHAVNKDIAVYGKYIKGENNARDRFIICGMSSYDKYMQTSPEGHLINIHNHFKNH